MKDDEKAKSTQNQGLKKKTSRSPSIQRSARKNRIENLGEPGGGQDVLQFTQFVVDNMSDAVYWVASSGELVYVNNASCQKLGYSQAELLSMRIMDFVPDYSQAEWSSHMRTLKQKGTIVLQSRHKKKNGELFPVEVRTNFVKYGNKEYACGIAHDISERKRSEEALRATQNFLTVMLENAPMSIYATSAEGRLLLVNRAWETSRHMLRGEAIGSRLDELFPEELARHLDEDNRRVIETAAPLVTEESVDDPDGRHYYHTVKFPLRGDANRVESVGGISIDITERKQAEDRLHDSEERYRDLVENSHELIYTHDLHGQLLSVNHTAALGLGYTTTSLVGRNLGEMLVPEERNQFEGYLGRIRRKTSDAGTWALKSTTGERRIWEYHSTLRSDSKQGPYVRGMAHDITERMRAEEELRESEEKWRSLVKTIPDFIAIHDQNGKFLFLNHYAEGFSEEDVIGSSLYDFLEPESRQVFKNNLDEIQKNGEMRKFEYTAMGAHGEMKEYEEYLVPLKGSAGKNDVLSIARDISERKHAEETLQHRNAELTALNQFGQALSRLAEPFEILELIFTMIGQVLDDRNLFIALYDRDSQDVSFPVYAINGERIHGGDRPLSNGITDYVIRTNKPFLVKRNLEKALDQCGIELIGTPSRSFLAVPMRHGEKVIGVIALQDYEKENAYNEQQLELLTTMAAQATTALENAQLFTAVRQELEERKRAETALAESQALLNSITDSTTDMIWAVNPDHFGLMSYNRSLNDYFLHRRGMHIEIGMRPEDLFPTDDFVQKWRGFYQHALKEGSYSTEYDVFAKSNVLDLRLHSLERNGVVFGVSVFAKDITEQKRSQEALRESEYRYRAVFEGVEDAIFIESPDGIILDANRRACEMFGYSHEEFLTKKVADLVPSIDYIVSFNPKDSPTLPIHPIETVNVRANGERFPIELNIRMQTFNGEQVLFVVGRDVTERKRVQELLQASEARFKMMFEQAPLAINITRGTAIIYANPAYLKMFEYSSLEDLQTLPPLELFTPEFRPVIMENIRRRAQGLPAPNGYEAECLRKDGTRFSVIMDFARISFVDGPATVGFILDITDRKRAEQALHDSEERFKQIAEQTEEWIWEVNEQGLYTISSPVVEKILGYSPGELIGRKYFYDLFVPDQREGLKEAAFAAFARKESIKGFINENVHKDGRTVILETNGIPIFDASGSLLGYRGADKDITERKRAEKELANSREQLRALSRYLQAAREEERTFIAREIHDELGQELTALKMDLAWLTKQLPQEQSLLIQKTGAMSDMVDGTIQTVRRVASQLRPGMLDDLGLVAALEWQAGEFQSRTGITCKLDLPEGLSTLGKDQATAMFRIFQETLTNIGRHAHATKVRVALKEQPGCIDLVVRDDGIGITEDQLNDPRSLGLTGMRERVQAFGGTLQFKSVKGKGTSVRLRMPLANKQLEKEA
jgi:PAS domain S-box-containing protein